MSLFRAAVRLEDLADVQSLREVQGIVSQLRPREESSSAMELETDFLAALGAAGVSADRLSRFDGRRLRTRSRGFVDMDDEGCLRGKPGPSRIPSRSSETTATVCVLYVGVLIM